MNKKFTYNEIRAYSKNRFEERALRHRLEKLREELTTYHDVSAKHRVDLIEENKGIRKTSGGSPVPAALRDPDEDFFIGKRLQRPWAYSAMETTYNSIYREAEIPFPKKCKRPRAKSAVTITLYNASSVTADGDETKSQKVELPRIPRTTQSAKHAGIVSFVNHSKENISENYLIADQNKQAVKNNIEDDVFSVGGRSDSDQNSLCVQDNRFLKVTHPWNEHEGQHSSEHTAALFSDMIVDTRPYAKVLSLPPAYTIDSKAYQEAERDRLVQRSRSRVSFSSHSGITSVANTSETFQSKDKPVKTPDKPDNLCEAKDKETTKETINKQDEVITAKDEDQLNRANKENTNKNTLKANENVKFRGLVIKNYIKPEDRYKLDPSILKRRQNRMDKLANESSTFLKRINHENIKVEIAFPRSARKRLLTKLVQENISGRKKTITDDNSPFIQSKVERFMVSISDYIENQQLERAKTFIY